MDTFYIADTHFRHKNIHKFRVKADGSPFASSDEHDEYVLDRLNTYLPRKCYLKILGDVAFNEEGLKLLHKLPGDKTLLQGNHDLSYDTMRKYCGKVCAMLTTSMDGINVIMTHIPIHFSQMERWHLNVHGHTHAQTLKSDKHYNVSLEAINYIPITLDEIITNMTREIWFGRGR